MLCVGLDKMKEKQNMKCNIITGVTGFIGTSLCRKLLESGERVVAIVRPGSEKRKKLEKLLEENQAYHELLQIIEMNLFDISQLSTKFHICADVFYHLAWNGSSGAERNDFEMQYSNIQYTTEAIRTAKACGCKKFVGAGSQAEYGVVHGLAKEEETVPHPFMMYGAAKLAAYQMGQVVAKQVGIKLIWPRIYSVYGVGENPGTLVNYVIDTLQKGEVPELSPCENMWNFMYITDCVRALCTLGESEEAEGIYNVASDDTRVLRGFVEEIRDIVAPEMKLNFGAKIADPQRTFFLDPDVTRLKETGFTCQVAFEKGIQGKSNDE